jgi:hypothetical protein
MTIRPDYFSGCADLDEAKRRYRALALEHHPDRPGGNTAKMQEINADYAHFQASFTNRAERVRQQEAHDEGRKTNADFNDLDEVTAMLEKIILDLISIPGLDVELCGLWIWVSGETRAHKEELKTLHLRFARKKGMWYFAGVPSSNRKPRTIEWIRDTYGSIHFQPVQEDT